jgi:HrpA-like RNA helicase
MQVPEMHRVPLEELCLQIKILDLGEIASFLGKAIEPPEASSISNAITSLEELDALDKLQFLTPLGYHLAQLPVDVR